MGNILGGIALLAVAAFMLLGFVRSDADASAPATLVALMVGIALPALGGIALLRRTRTAGRDLDHRRDQLRRQTLDAEVLRLAGRHQGRLTAVELMTEFALPDAEARATLESLMIRGMADVQVSDAGVLVYVFHDVQNLDSKHRSQKVIE